MKFGEVVLKVFEHRTAIDEITLVNIRSMPNLAISSLKPNFGIAFHVKSRSSWGITAPTIPYLNFVSALRTASGES